MVADEEDEDAAAGGIGDGANVDDLQNPYLEKRAQHRGAATGEDSDSDEGEVRKEDVDSDDEPVNS